MSCHFVRIVTCDYCGHVIVPFRENGVQVVGDYSKYEVYYCHEGRCAELKRKELEKQK